MQPANQQPKQPGIGFTGIALTILGIVLVAAVVFMIVSWQPGTPPVSAMNPPPGYTPGAAATP